VSEHGDILEYLTGNEMIAFPFKEDAQGLVPEGQAGVHGATAGLTRNALVDLVMTVPAVQTSQLYLKSISRLNDTWTFNFGTVSIILKSLIIESLPAARSLLETNDPVSRIAVRMIAGSGLSDYLDTMVSGSQDDFGTALPLETAAVEFTPYKLLGIKIGNDTATGIIELREGYNTQIDGVQGSPSQLTLNAGPGLGLGKHPCEDSSVALGYLARINGQTADDGGNFTLEPGEENCYRMTPYPETNELDLSNDCVQCCTCQDYANQVAALKALYARLQAVKSRLTNTTVKLNQDATLWNTDVVPKMFELTLDAYITIGNKFQQSGRSPNWASVIMIVKNPGQVARVNVAVNITMPPGLTTVFQTYFDEQGQHEGNLTSVIIQPGRFYKSIWLVKSPGYPTPVAGDFVFTVDWQDVHLTKTVAV